MSTAYHGQRMPGGQARVTTPDGQELPPRHDLRDHSPSGFEWGYAGSGPLQLGLALLAHAQADDEVALEHYRDFTRMIVATLPERDWSLTAAEIAEALASIQNLRGK
jgi:hypothetical protein